MTTSEQEYKLCSEDYEEMGKYFDELRKDEFLAEEAKYAATKRRINPLVS